MFTLDRFQGGDGVMAFGGGFTGEIFGPGWDQRAVPKSIGSVLKWIVS